MAKGDSSRLDSHEKVCTERYGNINDKLVAMDMRFNTISNRMWAAACGLLVCAAASLGGLILVVIGFLQRHV